MITQLNPPLPLMTPKGPALAHFLIDYGPESHLMWVCFLDENGQCWTVPNPEVRMAPNWSMQRRYRVEPPPIAALRPAGHGVPAHAVATHAASGPAAIPG